MIPNTKRASRGFTLVELMVVIGVISVLIALLLPAIQSSREAARRVQCVNNLLQLGTALANYESSNKVFPPGTVDAKGPVTNDPVGLRLGWGARILPFLERTSLYNQLNFARGAFDEENATAINFRLYSFLCPSDGRPAFTNYAGCHNDVEAPIDADNHGVFFLNSRVSRRDLTDGPATTILLGETTRAGALGTWAMGTAASLRNTGREINAENPFDPQPPAVASYPSLQDSFDPTLLQTMVDDDAIPPDVVGGFSSNHSKGANFLFGDGSVRHLKSKIEASVFRSLGNRADGNLIDADAF